MSILGQYEEGQSVDILVYVQGEYIHTCSISESWRRRVPPWVPNIFHVLYHVYLVASSAPGTGYTDRGSATRLGGGVTRLVVGMALNTSCFETSKTLRKVSRKVYIYVYIYTLYQSRTRPFSQQLGTTKVGH